MTTMSFCLCTVGNKNITLPTKGLMIVGNHQNFLFHLCCCYSHMDGNIIQDKARIFYCNHVIRINLFS